MQRKKIVARDQLSLLEPWIRRYTMWRTKATLAEERRLVFDVEES
jgi:hypothetical protein